MLASITPLGERGRHSRWSITVSAFLLSSTAAGVLVGAALGGTGALLLPSSLSASERLLALGAATLLAACVDVFARRVPGPARQVDEQWLHAYRGWVYGGGFGAQLGLGVSTVVTSAATYAALLAALVSGSLARGALIVGCFGALRGLTLFLAAGVSSPERLLSLHARLTRWRAPVARAALLVLVAVVVLAVIGAGT
jgi:cytochrome c biogenesis protein CcdA